MPCAFVVRCVFALLPTLLFATQSRFMSTVTKVKKRVRPAAKKTAVKLTPRVKNLPVGSIKLADWEIELMKSAPSYGPDV
jgi:hypothetical protein